MFIYSFYILLKEQPPKNKELDDDQDKKNPAYVPRKGAFYEHDFRNGDNAQAKQPKEE